MLVLRYKLSLCHTPIKPDLLGFPGIGVFAYGLRDHVITRFASFGIRAQVAIPGIGMIIWFWNVFQDGKNKARSQD